MDLVSELKDIGKFLKNAKSPCHYNDYVNVFKFRHGSKVSYESITRLLRKMREQGIFITPPNMRGQFFIKEVVE